MNDRFRSRERILLMGGILLVLSGLLLNEWFLAALFSSDGAIAVPHRIIIWITDLLFIIIGIATIMYRRSISRIMLLRVGGVLLISAGIISLFFVNVVVFQLNTGIIVKTISLLSIIILILGGTVLFFFWKSIEKKNILLFAISSLLCFMFFLIVDFCTTDTFWRIVFPNDASETVLVQDDHLGWKLRANSRGNHVSSGNFNVIYDIDENGFRKINNTADSDFSIYFFGDSFIFGNGVNNNENFPCIIKERYLKRTISVYNAGVGAYGITQMYQLFLNIDNRIRSGDLVIFTPLTDDILRNIKDFYFPYYHFLAKMILFEDYPYFDEGAIKYHKMEKSFYNKLKVVALYARFSGKYWRDFLKEFIPDTTREALEMIKIVKQRTEIKGGKFVLFFLPETGECLSRKYNLDISDFNYYDIIRSFPSQEDELMKIRFTGNDGHWNVSGHKIAARAIVETLIKEKFIDKKYIKDYERVEDK